MTRRLRLLAIAFGYLLASTNLLPLSVDRFAPRTKTIASADFPCAHHDCGCNTAEQCRLHCCCHPAPQRQRLCALHERHGAASDASHEAKRVTVRYLAAAQCAGHTPDTALPTAQKLQPHLPLAWAALAMAAPAHRPAAASSAAPVSAFRDPLDKIPI